MLHTTRPREKNRNMTTRRSSKLPICAVATGGKPMIRFLLLALGLALSALLTSCATKESCNDECNRAYEECLKRAHGDANAEYDCGAQKTNCIYGCVPGSSFALVAPDADDIHTIPEDTLAGNDDCPCKRIRREIELRQAEEIGKRETAGARRALPAFQ
jgi:hypothetical protein